MWIILSLQIILSKLDCKIRISCFHVHVFFNWMDTEINVSKESRAMHIGVVVNM